jgi:ATP-dependent DNA ligase
MFRYSEALKNAEQLLAKCRQRGREGIVSKKKHPPYKSGKCNWLKVKCRQLE